MAPRQASEVVQDPYRGVSVVLLAAAIFGMMSVFVGGLVFGNPVMLAAGIALGLAAGVLGGVLKAQAARTQPPRTEESATRSEEGLDSGSSGNASDPAKPAVPPLFPPLKRDMSRAWKWFQGSDFDIGSVTAFLGSSAVALLLMQVIPENRPTPLTAGIAIVFALAAAGLAAIAARYLANIDPVRFPESIGLCRGARVMAWILALVAVSVVFAWANLEAAFRATYFAVLLADVAICVSLFRARQQRSSNGKTFPLDFALLSILGRRPNILASAFDAIEQQLGIDLRSTWALTIVRRTLEPLAIGLCLAAWLSTSLTVVEMDEQGLVERLGVPQDGQLLGPGLHLHWPWPIDRVFRIPVERVQTVQVGHEGEEAEGPENVLWAVEHAPNEFTLVLGNGRDLITVDAAVQYRIVDALAWHYHCQNPAAALKAIAYRAVMRSTVDLTLSQALSQNISIVAGKMRAMVQKDADDLGLGVHILAFTVSGMHPPVPVAPDYEAVVSAQLEAVTAAVDAQVYRNQTVPAAESAVIAGENTARAEGAQALALAAGQAWSFRALESQYRAAPGEYLFRRRLETLEKDLSKHPYTVVDRRFLRDGGEIWQTQ